jgi:hypothetical protein
MDFVCACLWISVVDQQEDEKRKAYHCRSAHEASHKYLFRSLRTQYCHERADSTTKAAPLDSIAKVRLLVFCVSDLSRLTAYQSGLFVQVWVLTAGHGKAHEVPGMPCTSPDTSSAGICRGYGHRVDHPCGMLL